jgi:SEC-C motif-containing protein
MISAMPDHDLPCPCGLNARYTDCCGRFHDGPLRLQAPDAEALMRSRYSAYVLDRLDYLRDTWHPDTCPELEPHPPGLRWLGLEVRQHQRQDDRHATVEFVARSKLGGRAHRLHELSRFEQLADDGAPPRWVYRDGDLR